MSVLVILIVRIQPYLWKPINLWFESSLRSSDYDINQSTCKIITANSDSGLLQYIQTHAKAYGQEASDQDLVFYKEDISAKVFYPENAFTAFINNIAVGCISYSVIKSPNDKTCILISDLGVPIDKQKKGFSNIILNLMLNLLSKNYAPGILLICEIDSDNTASIKAFQKAGFSKSANESWYSI